MKWDEWKFSARRAVQDHFIKWTTVTTVVLFVGTSGYFLFRLIPEGLNSGVITLHYNIYLGIDEVRTWHWIFLIPCAALAMLVFDILFAFGIFRRDALASRALMAIGLASIILWAIGSFFLVLVNT